MLDWTDRHCRYFHRLMTRQTLLYTEMVTTGAIIHGKGDYLGYSEQEHPLALQLGGSNPADLARCARLAEERGYDGSTSTSAAPPIGCKTAASAPASWANPHWWPIASRRCATWSIFRSP